MQTMTAPQHQEIDFNFSVHPADEKKVFLFLKEHIFDQASFLKCSIWLGVTPTSLRKFLSGRPVSMYLLKKLSQRIHQEKSSEEALFQSPKIQRILYVYRLYQEEGTLSGVSKKIGLTRERVRQLLQNGEDLSLFEYKKPSLLPSLAMRIPKEKIIEDYQNLLQLKQVAKGNGISIHQLYQLIKYHQITRKELESARRRGQQIRSVLQYFTFFREKGKHLSSTELQKTAEGRYLSFKITKLWGSIHTFRKEIKIPFGKNLKQDCKKA